MLGKLLGSIVGLPTGVVLEATGRTSIATGKLMINGGMACLRGADRCYGLAGHDRDSVLLQMLRCVCKHLDGKRTAEDLPPLSTNQWVDVLRRLFGDTKLAQIFETTDKNEIALAEDLRFLVRAMMADPNHQATVKDAANQPDPPPEPAPDPAPEREQYPDNPAETQVNPIPGGPAMPPGCEPTA